MPQYGSGTADAQPSRAVDEGPQPWCVRSVAPYGLAECAEDQGCVLGTAPAGEHSGRGGAERVGPPGPAPGAVHRCVAAHPLEGGDARVGDGA